MINGKTESGFEFGIKEEVLDDYELLEVLGKVDRGEVGYVPDMVEMLLGTEQKNRLKAHIRKEHGRITVTDMINEVMQIFNANKELKNS